MSSFVFNMNFYGITGCIISDTAKFRILFYHCIVVVPCFFKGQSIETEASVCAVYCFRYYIVIFIQKLECEFPFLHIASGKCFLSVDCGVSVKHCCCRFVAVVKYNLIQSRSLRSQLTAFICDCYSYLIYASIVGITFLSLIYFTDLIYIGSRNRVYDLAKLEDSRICILRCIFS